MSFDVVCEGCGAVSGPSVGMCPFCKTVQYRQGAEMAGQNSVVEFYQKGNVELALSLAKKLYSKDEKSKKDISFLLLYAKILLETEGPDSLINSLLTEGLLLDSQNSELKDYLELSQARPNLKKGIDDLGELALKNILRRSPDNIHALFLLGSHLYWVDSSYISSVHYLERCVQLAPKFLRAWGCLSVVYKKLGNVQLCHRSLQKCIEIETNPNMKQYFVDELKKIA